MSSTEGMCAGLVFLFVLFFSYWERNAHLGKRWTGQNNGEGWMILRLWPRFTYLPAQHSIPLHKTQLTDKWKIWEKIANPYVWILLCLRSVQLLSRVWLFAIPWIAARQAPPSPTPRVHPNSCAWSRWCHPAISSSVVPFSSCPQSLPASGSFPMSQLFAWGGKSIGVSASASVLPMNTQDWSPIGWTGWISLQSKGLSRVFSSTTVQKHQFFCTQLSSQSNSDIHTWPLENHSLD